MAFVKLMNDKLFMTFFGDPENIFAIEYFLECYRNLRKGSLKGKIHLAFEKTLQRKNIKSKTNRCDIVIVEKDMVTNIEAYTQFGKNEMYKSGVYVCNLGDFFLSKMKKYKTIKKIVQINIVEKLSDAILEKQCESALTVFPLTEMLEIVIIRLDMLDKVDYNHGERTKDYVTFLKYLKAENEEERISFEKKGRIYKKMNEKILNIIRDGLNPNDFDHDAWCEELAYRNGERKGEKRGITIGEERGITKGEDSLIQKMISKGKTDEDIANTTEIDIARIRKLRESMI